MQFIQHPSNNLVLGAPQGWDRTVLPCGALPVTCTHSIDENGKQGPPAMVSFWQPDAQELINISQGLPIRLWVVGDWHPVVAMDVEGA